MRTHVAVSYCWPRRYRLPLSRPYYRNRCLHLLVIISIKRDTKLTATDMQSLSYRLFFFISTLIHVRDDVITRYSGYAALGIYYSRLCLTSCTYRGYASQGREEGSRGVRGLRWFGIPVGLGIACLAALQLQRTLRRERRGGGREEGGERDTSSWQVCQPMWYLFMCSFAVHEYSCVCAVHVITPWFFSITPY